MPPEPAALLPSPPDRLPDRIAGGARRRPGARRRRIADVTLFHGERSGGIRTYLEAKADFARRTGAFEHHLVVPGPNAEHDAARAGVGAGELSGRLAVALHDVEPRSFARAREIRAWLLARGVERVTLLVIPAADLHPIGARAPGLAAWLRFRVASGDAVAQHGLVHKAAAVAPWPRSLLAGWQGGAAAEFPGLDREDAARRVDTGRRLLREIELDPRGFVAPGYAYTRVLRLLLTESFEWFADLRGIRTSSGASVHAPALCLSGDELL